MRSPKPFSLLPVAIVAATLAAAAPSLVPALQTARDHQDRATLDAIIAKLQAAAKAKATPEVDYQLALANSYGAEIAMEQGDKKKSEQYAEAGIESAQKAITAKPNDAEYHRVYGNLCGQVIPANPIFGSLKYGQCARDELNKALQLDPKLALAYVSRGVGNYYLPEQFGGGVDVAVKDFDKAIALDPSLSEAYLWKGIALRKINKNSEARQLLTKAVELRPGWTWAKEQLQKTPAR
jgi:tetratricopeptide (TPR) repeat protein